MKLQATAIAAAIGLASGASSAMPSEIAIRCGNEFVGAGVFISDHGHVLTAAHVIQEPGAAKPRTVQLYAANDAPPAVAQALANCTQEIRLVWCDPTRDLAVIQIVGLSTPAATLGPVGYPTIGSVLSIDAIYGSGGTPTTVRWGSRQPTLSAVDSSDVDYYFDCGQSENPIKCFGRPFASAIATKLLVINSEVEHGMSGTPVFDGGKVRGVITDTLRRNFGLAVAVDDSLFNTVNGISASIGSCRAQLGSAAQVSVSKSLGQWAPAPSGQCSNDNVVAAVRELRKAVAPDAENVFGLQAAALASAADIRRAETNLRTRLAELAPACVAPEARADALMALAQLRRSLGALSTVLSMTDSSFVTPGKGWVRFQSILLNPLERKLLSGDQRFLKQTVKNTDACGLYDRLKKADIAVATTCDAAQAGPKWSSLVNDLGDEAARDTWASLAARPRAQRLIWAQVVKNGIVDATKAFASATGASTQFIDERTALLASVAAEMPNVSAIISGAKADLRFSTEIRDAFDKLDALRASMPNELWHAKSVSDVLAVSLSRGLFEPSGSADQEWKRAFQDIAAAIQSTETALVVF